MKVLKQVAGIDVAQKELVITLGRMYEDLSVELYAYKVFKNTEKGFLLLTDWVNKLTEQSIEVLYVMEATGVYHQKFAYYLDDKKMKISIVLPNKISNFFRTLEVKTVTDKTCSQVIARFGLERKLNYWKRPKAIYKTLQQLTRERDQIVSERVVAKNQLHAENSEAEPNLMTLKRINERIQLLNKQEKEIKENISDILKQTPELQKEVNRLMSIPGVGQLTAVIILAETNGFELIRNKKQVSSYAGLDVKEKQSGTSIKGKPRISKKGNRSLRRAMHFPALTAVKWDENFKEIYARMVSKHGIKMKALIAIQRKILELTYVLFKKQTEYDKEYEAKKEIQKNSVQTQVV